MTKFGENGKSNIMVADTTLVLVISFRNPIFLVRDGVNMSAAPERIPPTLIR